MNEQFNEMSENDKQLEKKKVQTIISDLNDIFKSPVFNQDTKESVNHAIDILEKHIPRECNVRKIKRENLGLDGNFHITDTYNCPVCEAAVGNVLYEVLPGAYCHKCGQALCEPKEGD